MTEHDLEAIKQVACGCPHGMTAEDVYRLRDVLTTWERFKSNVGGYVIKVVVGLVLVIGILVSWITNRGS